MEVCAREGSRVLLRHPHQYLCKTVQKEDTVIAASQTPSCIHQKLSFKALRVDLALALPRNSPHFIVSLFYLHSVFSA